MIINNLNRETLIKSLPLWLLCLVFCFNILPFAIQSIAIILFVSCSLLINYKNLSNLFNNRINRIYLIIVAWVVLLYLTTFYSIEYSASFIYAKKSINILILPFAILFLLPKLTIKQVEIILKIFTLSCLIFSIYLFQVLLSNLELEYLPELNNLNVIDKIALVLNKPQSEILWYGLKEVEHTYLFIHKTYFSMSFVFAIFCILKIFIKRQNEIVINIFWIITALMLSFSIVYITSFINMFILILGIFIILFLGIKSISKKIIAIVCTIAFLLIGFFCFYNVMYKKDPVLVTKIRNKINFVMQPINLKGESTDIRSKINACSYSLALKKPIFGYGLGEQHIHLSDCFAREKEFLLVEENFNTHNYYYFLLLSGGILVFVPFIIMLFYLMYQAIKFKDTLFFLLLLLLGANMITENILTRINGILFFSLFIPLFIRHTHLKLISK